MMRILLLLSFLCLSAVAHSQERAQNMVQSEACDDRLREVVNGLSSEFAITDEQWIEVVQSCAGRDVTLDISYQALLMLFGPQLIDAMDMANAISKGLFDFSADIDEAEARRIAGMYPQFQALIGGLNTVLVSIFIVFIAARLFIVAFTAQTGDSRKSHMKEAVKRDGFTWLSGAMLLAPAGGVLSVIQYMFITGLVFAVLVSKFLATIFFIGNGSLSLMSVVQEEVSDDLASLMRATAIYETCALKQRDNLLDGIKTARGYNATQLLEDPYAACLTEDVYDSPFQTNLGSELTELRGTVSTVDNANVGVTMTARYDIGMNRKVRRCSEQHADSYPNVGKVSSCGDVVLTIPQISPDKISAYKSTLEDVFLSNELQNNITVLAAISYQKQCRGGSDLLDGQCYLMDVTKDNLPLVLATDRDGSERARYVPFGEGQETQLGVEKTRRLKAQEIKTYLSGAVPRVARDRLALTNEDSIAETLGIEEDIEKIRRQIDKGIWMTGVAFSNQFGAQLNTALIEQAAKGSYSVDLKGPGFVLGIADTLLGDESTMSPKMGFFPEITMFRDVDRCWEDPVYCQEVSLNPFGALAEQGMEIFDRAILFMMGNKVMVFVNSGIESRAIKGLTDVFGLYAVIYLIIGAVFCLIIPLMVMFTLLGKLLVWLKDAVMVMISIGLDVTISPMMVHDQKVVAMPIRNAFKSLYVLSAHLLFISVGVIVCFLLLSFLMSMNMVLFGVIFHMFELYGEGGLLDNIVYKVIRDITIMALVFFEVKYAISMINKIPEALAKHYALEFGKDEPVLDKFVNTIKNKVAPQLMGIFGK